MKVIHIKKAQQSNKNFKQRVYNSSRCCSDTRSCLLRARYNLKIPYKYVQLKVKLLLSGKRGVLLYISYICMWGVKGYGF